MNEATQQKQTAPPATDNGGNTGKDTSGKENEVSVWEWITGGLGLVLVLGAIGFVLYQAIWGSETPADVQVSATAVLPVSNGYLVTFTARNLGGTTLEGVVVAAQLKQGEETVERSETTIEFLPARSTRKGGFFFQKNPQEHRVELHASGYEEP